MTCGKHESSCGTSKQWPMSIGLTLMIITSLLIGPLCSVESESVATTSFSFFTLVKLNWSALNSWSTLVILCGGRRFEDLFGWYWTRKENFPGKTFSKTLSILYLKFVQWINRQISPSIYDVSNYLKLPFIMKLFHLVRITLSISCSHFSSWQERS